MDTLRDIKKIFAFFTRYIKSCMVIRRFSEVPVLDIEITNICNAKCVFCPNTIMKRKREHLDMGLFKKAVGEFVTMGGREISFNSVIGDPLLDPYLLERIKHVRQFPQFKALGFVTNLQNLHNININDFLDSGITWLSISSAFSGRQKYFDFFGVDVYEQTQKNIINLIQENKKRGSRIELLFSIKPTNERINLIFAHPDFKKIDLLTNRALSRSLNNQALCVDDWTAKLKIPSYLKKRPIFPRFFAPCRLLYNSLVIFSNGNIGICPCRDFESDSDLIFGNIKDLNLQELWLGERIKSIVMDWANKNKVPEICKRCSHYVY